jgi:hypothetical protein
VIARSRSDEIVRRIRGDDDSLDVETAKELLKRSTIEALAAELHLADYPMENMEDLVRFCIFVNKNDLLALTIEQPTVWPMPSREFEIHERDLLRALGKSGT